MVTRTKTPPLLSTNFHMDASSRLAPLLSSKIPSEQRWLRSDGNETNGDDYIYESPIDDNSIYASFDTVDTTMKHCADYYLPCHEVETLRYDNHLTLEEHCVVNNDDEPIPCSEKKTSLTACGPGTEAYFPELSPIPEDWSTHLSRDEMIRLGIPVFQQANHQFTSSHYQQDGIAENMEDA